MSRVKKLCLICREKEATVPDRNKPWSKRRELCSDCHGNRLKNDLVDILIIEAKRRAAHKEERRG